MEACGSQADLLSKGLDPQHLIGMISADKQDECNELYAYKDDESVAGLLSCRDGLYECIDVAIIAEENDFTQSPSSPLLGSEKKKTQLVSFLKGHHGGNESPSLLRKRNFHIPETLPGRQPDNSMLDTASLYSSPSMLSLHFDEDGEESAQTKPHIFTEKIEVSSYYVTLAIAVAL